MSVYAFAIGAVAFIYVLLALGLNLQWGHTGLINFGHVAFFALGAYTTAIMTTSGAPVYVGVVVGVSVAALFAFPIGWLTLRLRDDYLAIVTIGFSEVVRLIFLNSDWAGGATGIVGIPRLFIDFPREYFASIWFYFTLGIAVVTTVLMYRISESPFGRILRAIKSDEVAALSLGKDVAKYKTTALVLGSAIAGLGGGLYTHWIGFISPEQFLPLVTFYVWTAIILGGSSHLGSALGMLVLMILLEGSRYLGDFGVPIAGTTLAFGRFILVGVLLVVLLQWKPDGLRPYRPKKRTEPEHIGSVQLATGAIDRAKAEPVLTVKDVTVSFGALSVLRGASLDVRPGLMTALIGPNGAGKSTLFDVISGLTRPAAGDVTLDGVPITFVPPARVAHLGLGRTFQIPRPFGHMTVLENLLTAAPGHSGESFLGAIVGGARTSRSSTDGVATERAWEVCDFLTLTPLANDRANSLSGGQLKLLELGRILMLKPKVILLDEPIAGVNPTLSREIASALRHLVDEGVALLLIEHNMEFVMENADFVYVMAAGTVICSGTPEQVRNAPEVLEAYLGSQVAV